MYFVYIPLTWLVCVCVCVYQRAHLPQETTPLFWHLEDKKPSPAAISHLRALVLQQLARVEGSRAPVPQRGTLVAMATDELYTFLVRFLEVVFSLRDYDTIGTYAEQAQKEYA